MKILSYEASGGDSEGDIHFKKMSFGTINLIIGNTATGKTRLLNTLFNGARLITHKDRFYVGSWDITFKHNSLKYRWVIETRRSEDNGKGYVYEEQLIKYEDDNETILVKRSSNSFVFNGEELPKLSHRETSISLLQEEELIKPVYQAFSSIMRRDFSGPDLQNVTSWQTLPPKLLHKIEETRSLKDLFEADLALSCKLLILSKFFKEIYDNICDEFINTFPFISEVKIFEADQFDVYYPGHVPVFSLKEKDINKWIPLHQFSSGMKKVLLILCDVFTLPEEGYVYLIDEYENSLGINAINFFPTVLLEAPQESQFIITSHHPYIIGNVPVKDWIVFHRKGKTVEVKQGEELKDKFGKSKQKAFIQLINDPFYVEGIE